MHHLFDMKLPKTGLEESFMQSLTFSHATMLSYGAKSCKHLADAYQEWFAFLGRRMEEDAQFAEKLSKLKDPQEITAAYSAFLEKATSDYQSEIAAMAKFTGEFSNDMTDALQDLGKSPEAGAVLGE